MQIRRFLPGAVLLLLLSAVIPPPRSSGEEFKPIFDGETLSGWKALPGNTLGDWTAEHGAIVGRGSADRLSYLVFHDHQLRDFELCFRYRLRTNGNTGVEIRARKDKSGKRPFEGYHADLGHVGIGKNVLGAWDFHFAKRREHPCPRGTQLRIDEDERGASSQIKNAVTLEEIRKRDWNDVRIVAKGNHFEFFINGKLSSEFTDNAKAGRLKRSAIALQLHDKGMRVEFKDLRLRRTE